MYAPVVTCFSEMRCLFVRPLTSAFAAARGDKTWLCGLLSVTLNTYYCVSGRFAEECDQLTCLPVCARPV